MVSHANDIYAQVGVTIDLVEPIVMTNIPAAYNVDLGDDLAEYWSCERLCNLAINTDGLECYFVNEIIKDDMEESTNIWTMGVNGSHGMVLTKHANGTALAHEIGHVFGLSDIYKDNTAYINEMLNPLKIDENEMVRAEFLSGDWSYGCIGRGEGGCGFYKKGLKMTAVIDRLLMNGLVDESSEMKDITAGNVYGVWYSGDSKVNENWRLDVAPIGFFYNENRKQHPKHE
jgi:hypothetical protein